MKTVYEANNSLEANIIQSVLQQAGLSPVIIGAYLQGGIGDLPTAGLVRLMISDEEYAAGREIIQAWEQQTLDDKQLTAMLVSPVKQTTTVRMIRWLILIALIIGIAMSSIYFLTSIFRINP